MVDVKVVEAKVVDVKVVDVKVVDVKMVDVKAVDVKGTYVWGYRVTILSEVRPPFGTIFAKILGTLINSTETLFS